MMQFCTTVAVTGGSSGREDEKYNWPPGRNTNGPMTNCWLSKRWWNLETAFVRPAPFPWIHLRPESLGLEPA